MITKFGQLQSQQPTFQGFIEMSSWSKIWGRDEVRENVREKARWSDTRAISMYHFLSLFHENERAGVREIGTEQVSEVLLAGTAVTLYYQQDEGLHHTLCREFMDCNLSTRYMNGAGYILKILKTRPRTSFMAQAMSHPRAFEMQLYFHALIFLEECRWTKLVFTVRKYHSGKRPEYAVQLVMWAWNTHMPGAGSGSIQAALQPYTF